MPITVKHPKPTPATTTTPAPTPNSGLLSRLTGTVRTFRPGSSVAYSVPWANITRYAALFEFHASTWKDGDPILMAAMAIVESDGNQFGPDGHVITRDDGFGDGPSVGILQVKPSIWQSLVPRADAYTADGNIAMGTAIMAKAITEHGTWQKALARVYFPTNDPNGTTQNAYVTTVTSLMAEIANQTQPAPAPPPKPIPVQPPKPTDPYAVIGGGHPYTVEYGFRDDVGLNYYSYGVNHGTTAATQHTGDDVLWPDETPLFTPIDAEVTCVGAAGRVVWGEGCAAYQDTTADAGHGSAHTGNITLLGEGGALGWKLVLGHCSGATVQVGQHVKAGAQVGYSGGMNGPHTHVEMAVQKDGSYWLLDPKPALIAAMGGVAPVTPVARVPYDLYASDANLFHVHATQDGVKIYQRADPSSPVVDTLKAGEAFEARAIVPGNDHKRWWLGKLDGRVPMDDTQEDT